MVQYPCIANGISFICTYNKIITFLTNALLLITALLIKKNLHMESFSAFLFLFVVVVQRDRLPSQRLWWSLTFTNKCVNKNKGSHFCVNIGHTGTLSTVTHFIRWRTSDAMRSISQHTEVYHLARAVHTYITNVLGKCRVAAVLHHFCSMSSWLFVLGPVNAREQCGQSLGPTLWHVPCDVSEYIRFLYVEQERNIGTFLNPSEYLVVWSRWLAGFGSRRWQHILQPKQKWFDIVVAVYGLSLHDQTVNHALLKCRNKLPAVWVISVPTFSTNDWKQIHKQSWLRRLVRRNFMLDLDASHKSEKEIKRSSHRSFPYFYAGSWLGVELSHKIGSLQSLTLDYILSLV